MIINESRVVEVVNHKEAIIFVPFLLRLRLASYRFGSCGSCPLQQTGKSFVFAILGEVCERVIANERHVAWIHCNWSMVLRRKQCSGNVFAFALVTKN